MQVGESEGDRWGGGRDDESEGPIDIGVIYNVALSSLAQKGMKGVSIYLSDT